LIEEKDFFVFVYSWAFFESFVFVLTNERGVGAKQTRHAHLLHQLLA